MKKTKKTKILSLVLAFLMMLTSVGVFAEETTETPETPETTETPYQLSQTAIELRDNIAAAICNTEDGWTAFTMAAYEKHVLGESKMDDDVKESIINNYIDESLKDSVSASDRARIEIVLSSLGKDTKKLYPIGEEKVDNSQALSLMDHTSGGHYAAPWILLADIQGNVGLSDEQIVNLISVLDDNKGTGLFESEWEGVTYTDADTASTALVALSRFNDDNAKALSDTIYDALKDAIDENGSFGSANSDAMVIIGLIALGENPYEFKNKTTEKSVVDGLLSYVNEENNGFTFYGTDNYMATEQGLRALIALSVYKGVAYNIYDFASLEKSPAYQTESDKITTLRDNIATLICNTEDAWTAFDMAAYQEHALGECVMSDETKQKIVDSYIIKTKDETTSVSDRAKIEIVLRSLGIDTKNLYPAGSDAPINNGELLKNANHTQSGHYAAPWILLADLQGNTGLLDEQIENLIGVLDDNKGTGLFESEWEGVSYTDADTAAATLSALAKFYDINDNAKTLCDVIYSALKDSIDDNGSFGNANSDAMVIIGLVSVGIDPYGFRNETTKKSIVDGLLSYVNESDNGFTFYGTDNYMATEQGLRALIALSVYEGAAYNIYDFSKKSVVPGYENAEETEIPEKPKEPVYTGGGGGSGKNNKKEPTPEPEKTEKQEEEPFKIVFKDVSGHWAEDSVLYVAEKGIMNGISEECFSPDENLTRGMLVTMLYRLSGDKAKGENEFTDVSADAWFVDAAAWASQNGITEGYGNGKFGADDEVTREQLAVFLKRYADLKKVKFDKCDTQKFEDADVCSYWAEDAILWAQTSGILSGRESNTFDPKNSATRAEIATVFMRFIEKSTK